MTISASILTFVVIVLGSWVRAKDAGLACPDWPLCYDKIVPTFDLGIFLEWFHRVVAGVLTMLLLVVTVVLFRDKTLRQKFSGQIAAALILLAVQIVLGGLTVLHLLEPKIVSLHLINAIAFFTVLMGIAYRSWASDHVLPKMRIPSSYKWLMGIAATLTFAQILMGGLVSSNHAGLACPEFPTCFGSWFPPYAFQTFLQMSHRWLGVGSFVFVTIVSIMLIRYDLPLFFKIIVMIIPVLFLVQIGLGVFNVYFQIPAWSSVLHLALAVFIYTNMALVTYDLAYRSESYVFAKDTTSVAQDEGQKAVGEVSHARS
jgi:cytochrome c oxidase assembly protein subunit 15